METRPQADQQQVEPDQNGQARVGINQDHILLGHEFLQNHQDHPPVEGRDHADQEVGSRQLAQSGITDRDVLLGRGKLAQYHPGNVRFRQFLESHADDYENTPRQSRTQISARWTRELLASGVHFWKKEEDGWIECSLEEVVPKVAQFFRTLRRKTGR